MGNTPHHAVRIPDDVWAAAKSRAHAEGHSLTSRIVAFLRAYGTVVADGEQLQTATGRVITTADLPEVAEAERGYDVDQLGPARRA